MHRRAILSLVWVYPACAIHCRCADASDREGLPDRNLKDLGSARGLSQWWLAYQQGMEANISKKGLQT